MEKLKGKRKQVMTIGGIVAAIVIVIFGWYEWSHVSTDNAQIDAHFVMIASKVGGYVTKVNVAEGQRVKKGDMLVQIDDRDYQNTVKQIKGELSSAQARRMDAYRAGTGIDSRTARQGAPQT